MLIIFLISSDYMKMNLEWYRVFLAVAQHHSFSGAAQELYITQPAVSQAIKQLERFLDTPLFVRTSKGVQLTSGGELLLDYAQKAFGILDRGERQFEELKTLQAGTLRIGAGDTLCRHYLLPHLRAFQQKYPQINIMVTNRTSDETVELLKAGQVDLGFVNLPLDIPRDIVSENMAALHDCFVYGERYFPAFDGTPVPLGQLQQHTLLVLEGQSASRRYLDEVLFQHSIALSPQIELGSVDLLLEFAAAGLGIAAVPREYAKGYLDSGTLRVMHTNPTIPPRHIGLIHHKQIPLPVAAQSFLYLQKQGIPL